MKTTKVILKLLTYVYLVEFTSRPSLEDVWEKFDKLDTNVTGCKHKFPKHKSCTDH